MFKNIDDSIIKSIISLEKSGLVKEDVFYQLLQLHGIDLSKEAKTVISNTYKKGDKINYKDAMTVIGIDLETAAFQVSNWIVR